MLLLGSPSLKQGSTWPLPPPSQPCDEAPEHTSLGCQSQTPAAAITADATAGTATEQMVEEVVHVILRHAAVRSISDWRHKQCL